MGYVLAWFSAAVVILLLVLPFLLARSRSERRAQKAWRDFSEGKWQRNRWE